MIKLGSRIIVLVLVTGWNKCVLLLFYKLEICKWFWCDWNWFIGLTLTATSSSREIPIVRDHRHRQNTHTHPPLDQLNTDRHTKLCMKTENKCRCICRTWSIHEDKSCAGVSACVHVAARSFIESMSMRTPIFHIFPRFLFNFFLFKFIIISQSWCF